MRRRGFTLIEVVVVCAILSVLAALVYPNVVAMKSGRERDAAYADVLRLAQMGRGAAIQSGHAYELSLEDNGTRVVLKQEEEKQDSTRDTRTNSNDTAPTNNKPQRVLPAGVIISSSPDAVNGVSARSGSSSDDVEQQSVSLPSGVQMGELTLDGKASSTSDFVLHFYPDGRSEGGGFEMVDRSTTRFLFVERNGLSKLQEGNLPAMSEPSWEAGQYEQRSGS